MSACARKNQEDVPSKCIDISKIDLLKFVLYIYKINTITHTFTFFLRSLSLSLCTETNMVFLHGLGARVCSIDEVTLSCGIFSSVFSPSFSSCCWFELKQNKNSRWQISIITDGEKNVFITVEYIHILFFDTHFKSVKVKIKQFFLSSYLKFCNFRYHLIARHTTGGMQFRVASLQKALITFVVWILNWDINNYLTNYRSHSYGW